jgi:hypothetical protein
VCVLFRGFACPHYALRLCTKKAIIFQGSGFGAKLLRNAPTVGFGWIPDLPERESAIGHERARSQRARGMAGIPQKHQVTPNCIVVAFARAHALNSKLEDGR